MIKQLTIYSLILFSFASFAQEKVKETSLNVAIGIDEVIKLDYKFHSKVQIGNQSVLGLIVSPARREITFRGVKAGKTSVTIRDPSGDIREKYIVTVQADGLSSKVMELRQLIGDVEGIDIVIRGGKIIVEGQLVVPNDIGKISVILARYNDVIRLIELSPQTQRIISRKMQEEINRNGMKDVTVRIVNKTFWLEGVVNSAAKKDLALVVAQEYLPDKIDSLGTQAGGSGGYKAVKKEPIINFITVNEKKDPEPPPKLIKVSSQFVELVKDYQKVFGFSWSPVMTQSGSISFGKTSEGGITTEESGTLSGTINNLFPRLSSAKAAGYARVIQSGMGVVEEKNSLSIKKNKKVPYSVGGGDFAQAQTADFGFEMRVTPEIADKEIVKLKDLNITVNLTAGKAEGGAPLSTTNSIATHLVIKSKQSAVIGGVVQTSSATNYDKSPPGGQTKPEEGSAVLFNLLRSKDYTTEKSQFVIFVTPEIIESASTGTEAIRKKFRKRAR